ncbi:MAG: glycerate kinase [Sphaerochaetaceae bacterium]|nr:glycerate kinase [Sphaerochaetaceae bacterium]MDD2406801.1 glycerate kinase [Sphaerochaetaceae bacterium]MDD4258506.1 glycerate kinase [Sphaerochaetaceae bacterium]MDD4840378.1 glycerate kinase [Sphaerochaetaceae bacterium]
MKKFLLIPDSFKGTMSSKEICTIMERTILRHYPDASITSIPVADGGEGSVDAFLTALGGRKVEAEVCGPFFEPMRASYGVINDTTAIVEMAACAGLPLVGDHKRPDLATTYGVGQLIAHAASNGSKRIIVGLGGSATNDGGVGAAAAVGIRFFDSKDKEFIPTGRTLSDIRRIDTSGKINILDDVEIITMCDIDNPLYGEHGAAYVYGPQKGADEQMVELLDKQLKVLSETIKEQLHLDVSDIPGAGAAGGMGSAMVAFFNSSLKMGIEVVLDTVSFDVLLENTDMVFTGEGKLDTSSLRGKVVIGIAKRTKKADVPLIAVVGDIGDDIDQAYQLGLSAVFSINRVAKDFKQVMKRAPKDLELTVDNIMRFLQRLGW